MTSWYSALGAVGVPGRRSDARELDACVGRGPRRMGRLGGEKRLPLELLGLLRIAARERVRAESGEGKRRVVAERDAPRKLERSPVCLRCSGGVLSSLCDPGLEQQPRNAERVVVDRVRVTADRGSHGGDGGNVADVRCARRTDEAARRDTPVVPGRRERRARFLRHRVGPQRVPGLRQGVREGQSREPELPGRLGAGGERERAFARGERGVDVELLGREVAEDGVQLDP